MGAGHRGRRPPRPCHRRVAGSAGQTPPLPDTRAASSRPRPPGSGYPEPGRRELAGDRRVSPEDVVGRPICLTGRHDRQSAIVSQRLEPGADVSRRLLEARRVDPGTRPEEGRCELGDELFAGVSFRRERGAPARRSGTVFARSSSPPSTRLSTAPRRRTTGGSPGQGSSVRRRSRRRSAWRLDCRSTATGGLPSKAPSGWPPRSSRWRSAGSRIPFPTSMAPRRRRRCGATPRCRLPPGSG